VIGYKKPNPQRKKRASNRQMKFSEQRMLSNDFEWDRPRLQGKRMGGMVALYVLVEVELPVGGERMGQSGGQGF